MDTQIIPGTTIAIPQLGKPNETLDFTRFNAEERISFVRPYDAKVTALEGYRHAVIRYRVLEKNKTANAEKPAKMVTVPNIVLNENEYLLPDNAKVVLIGAIEDMQDTFIREQIDAGKVAIKWDECTVFSMLNMLTATRTSSRLNRESIEAWVRVAMLPILTERATELSDAKNYNETQRAGQLAGVLNKYAKEYGGLGAPVPNIGEDTAKAILAMLDRSKLDDDMAKALTKKLKTILNPPKEDDGYL